MHNDDVPVVPALPGQANAVLTTLWNRLAESDVESMSRLDLRDPARCVAAEARSIALAPEHLIIAIKHSWSGFHDGVTRPYHYSKAHGLVTDMISMCIQEYYQPTIGTPVPPVT